MGWFHSLRMVTFVFACLTFADGQKCTDSMPRNLCLEKKMMGFCRLRPYMTDCCGTCLEKPPSPLTETEKQLKTALAEMQTLKGRLLRVISVIQPQLQANCYSTFGEFWTPSFTAICPPNCHILHEITIWGTIVYTTESSICRAAIHDGKITGAAGGPVTVYKRGLQNYFPGSFHNGVVSASQRGGQYSFYFGKRI